MEKYNEKIELITSIYKLIFDNVDYIDLENKFLKKYRRNSKIPEYELKLKINEKSFGSNELYIIAQYIKYCKSKKWFKIHFEIDLLAIDRFKDKITYLILDMMIFYFVNVCKTSDINILYDIKKPDFNTCALCSTAFQTYYQKYKNSVIREKKFNEIYLRTKHTEIIPGRPVFYRYLYTKFDHTSSFISKLSTDINMTLCRYFDEKSLNSICTAIEEIVDNATFHNDGVLLLDLHYSDELTLVESDGKSCNGVYIGILNLGTKNLYTTLSKKIKDHEYSMDDEVYKKVYNAYDRHKPFMVPKYNYNENLFFMITSFQKDVTSRYTISGNSGKGLTTLINSISGKILQQDCYVLSGRDIILFKDSFLKVDNGFIGFNENNDYLNSIPDKSVLSNSTLYCPGTIYNLCFIAEKIGDNL